MAKVDEPRFEGGGVVLCADCPFSDNRGICTDPSEELFLGCPAAETYAEACKLAGQEASK